MLPKRFLSGQVRRSPQQERADKPIPADLYPVLDNDLARDNLENDLPSADLEDL